MLEVLLERGRRAGPVSGGLRILFAEALDVDRDRGQDMLEVNLGGAVVAVAAHSMAVDDLVDGALDARAGVIEAQPGGIRTPPSP